MFVHRPILMSDAGMVVSGHHKASEAGAAVLRDGGNAIDAAVAASAVLCVAIPHMNGLGGDCIALALDASSGSVTAINGSGRAPAAATQEELRRRGYEKMPKRGPHSISVFGLVHAWQSVLDRWGTRPLSVLLQPAIELARKGLPTDLVLQTYLASPEYLALSKSFPALTAIYGQPGQRALGERITNPKLAGVLEAIARDGASTFYRGDVARLILADLAEVDALISANDLASHETRFDPSLSAPYGECLVHAAPPNAQGIALVVMSGLADLEAGKTGRLPRLDPVPYLQRKGKAFEVRGATAGDPAHTARPDAEITPSALVALAEKRADDPEPRAPGAGDTSTLVVVDRKGNAVSWVQSLFEDFGSGVVSPSTGVVMHNRLALQELTGDGPFALRAGHRPFHTLCPAIVERDGACEMAIATPGDHGQPQSIYQVLTRRYAEGMHIQAAIEAPRIRHDEGRTVMIESRAPAEWFEAVRQNGYDPVDIGPWSRLAGGVNAIERKPDGLLLAGADPRRASYAVSAE